MKWCVLVACCVQLALSLPQGYNYKDSGPVSHGFGGFQPNVGVTPCNHGHNAALVQQQSIGRIIHQGSGHGGSGHGLDSQAVTVNSHITVGDGGHSHSQVFREGQGYGDEGRPAPIALQQGPPLPLPGPAPPFLSQSFGSSHNSFGSSGSFNHAGHGGGSVVNGVGRVPAPLGPGAGLSGGYQQQHGGSFGGSSSFGSSGFGGSRPTFSGAQVNPNFIVGSGGASHQGSGSSYQNVGGFSGGGAHSHGGSGFSQQQSGGGGFSHGSASQSFGQSSGNFGSASGVLNGALGNVIRETFANAPLDPTVEKHIYVHVPPEDLEEESHHHQARHPEGAAAKKHYKIIFIKAPTVSQPSSYAQLASAGGISEEKTIVYVLVKKPEEPSFNEIQQLQQSIKPSKPEVYFIKYKTRNEHQGGGGGGGGFIGGSYNSNIEHSSGGHHVESIGTGSQFAGSEIDGGVDVRVNGSGSGIESTHDGGAILSSGSSSSGSSSSYSTSSSNVNIAEAAQPHEVYGVPSVPSV